MVCIEVEQEQDQQEQQQDSGEAPAQRRPVQPWLGADVMDQRGGDDAEMF